MIAVINYKAGNLASVSNALNRLNAEHIITNKKEELEHADGIIFPGVGHADPAMKSLKTNDLVRWLKTTNRPVLGICLGMQLLYESSEEGSDTKGLGIIPGKLKKFSSKTKKVPHMGWNTLTDIKPNPLLKGIDADQFFYYVHSFYAPTSRFTASSCSYIDEFTAIVCKDNYWGVQFHPEKSGKAGSQLLQNFLESIVQG